MDIITAPNIWDSELRMESVYYKDEVMALNLYSLASDLCMVACGACVIAGMPMMIPGLALGMIIGSFVTRTQEKDKRPCTVWLRTKDDSFYYETPENTYVIKLKKLKKVYYNMITRTLHLDGSGKYGPWRVSTVPIRVPIPYTEAVMRYFEKELKIGVETL